MDNDGKVEVKENKRSRICERRISLSAHEAHLDGQFCEVHGDLFCNILSSTEVGVTTTTTHNSLHGRYSARGRAVLGRPDPCCILSSGTARTFGTLSS